jgi:uncharacterized membrane protein
MQKGPLSQDDDNTIAPEQVTAPDAPRPSLFSATRASRIRRSSSATRPGAALGAAPTPGSTPTAPADTAAAPRHTGPRTYAHLAAGLCYLGTPIIPAAVLFSPKPHRFARFHAIQALALFIVAATLGFCLSLLTPTNLALGILFTLLTIALVALALLWMALAIAAFEGFALLLPLFGRLLSPVPNLEEDLDQRTASQRARWELTIAAGVSVVLLVLAFTLPVVGWFKDLSAKNLAPLGFQNGLPAWILVLALLSSLIFAGIGLVVLAAFLVGLRKGKFFPPGAGIAAIVGAAFTAAGTGFLVADTLQSALYSLLTQQFDRTINSVPLPGAHTTTNSLAQIVADGLKSLSALAGSQSHVLLPGAVLLLLGMGVLLFLLSQLYYKR